jgi:hypothetical protein
MSRMAAVNVSKASLHWAVATGVRVVSFFAVARAVAAACMSVSNSCKAAGGMPHALALAPATLCQSRAIAKIPSLLLGSQSLLVDIFFSSSYKKSTSEQAVSRLLVFGLVHF